MTVNWKDKGKMDDQIANREAAVAGLRSLERLVLQQSPSDCLEIADQTVAKFKKAIFTPNRTGHARFRRGPAQSASTEPEGALATAPAARNQAHPPPPPPPPPPQQAMFPEILTQDFAKTKESFSVLGTMWSSSFLSSRTGDGCVTGRQGPPILAPAAAVSAGKPPLPSSHKRKRPDHANSDDAKQAVPAGHCHCHCSKKRKNKEGKTIRLRARDADIPADKYSWRKYGQKPIKGSPYTRSYYKCSSVKGCPSRKHVERAPDEPSTLIVTYQGDHRHGQSKPGVPLHTEPVVNKNSRPSAPSLPWPGGDPPR